MSEMRRIAKALVAERKESFTSAYPRDESAARVAKAIDGFAAKRMSYEARWRDGAEVPTLDITTRSSRSTDVMLKSGSIVLTLLIASSVWAIFSADADGALAFLVPLTTALAILAFPFVVVAAGSAREAEEARLIRAIKKALAAEDS